MEAKELRIGNYVIVNDYKEQDKVVKVTEILDERTHLKDFYIGKDRKSVV